MAVAPTSSTAARQARASSVLEVRDLQAAFFTRRGVVRAVNGGSFSIGAGETLGLVGESGCGKTATAMSILRMLPFPGRITGGEIWFQGENLLAKPEAIMRSIRGREAHEEILAVAAERRADLVVIGLRRRTPVGKLLMGSTAQRVLLEATCPVLAVKAPR